MLPVRSKLGDSFVADIIDLAFGGAKQTTITRFATAGAFLLAIASGYTTFVGIRQYIPDFGGLFAFLATFGLQGLLVATSIRIGQTMAETRLYLSLKLIYAIVLLTSVFFSYSALLDNIYGARQRDTDQLQRARREAVTILRDVRTRATAHHVAVTNAVLPKLSQARSEMLQPVEARTVKLRAEIARVRAEYERLADRAEREQGVGITQTANGYSQPGPGPLARRYLEQAQTFRFTTLRPLEQDLAALDSATARAHSAYAALVTGRETVTLQNYASFLSSAKTAASEAVIAEPPASATLRNVEPQIAQIDDVNRFLRRITLLISLTSNTDLQRLRTELVGALNDAPIEVPEQLLLRASALGQGQGAAVHPFELAITEFSQGNILAIGAAFIALALDGLVLLCGLMAGRPQSYLWLKDSSQLDEVAEDALYTVLSLQLERGAHTPTRPHMRRILAILAELRPDVLLAKEGYPAILDRATVERLKLTQEVGVFIAMNLAVLNSDGQRIALSTRLLLWMAHQVVAGDAGAKMTDDAGKTF